MTEIEQLRARCAELESRLAEIGKQEPVAYVQTDPDKNLYLHEITKTKEAVQLDSWDRQMGWGTSPLYTHAPDSAARIAELEAEISTERCLSFRNQVAELENQRDELLAVFKLVIAEMEYRDRGDGNAPGHGHDIPGVWDSDNGELAGKPCAWCAVWKKAKGLCDAIDAAKGGVL